MSGSVSTSNSSVGSVGVDVSELDPNVRPQDDLFRHVNGQWIERTEIPSDKARYGSFHVLFEESEHAVHQILLDCQSAEPGSEQRKLGDLYTTFMDVTRIDERGLTPVREQLAAIAEIDSVNAFLAEVGRVQRDGLGGFLQMGVANDPGNPDRYVVFFDQGGLGLPDESYYREERFAAIREAYVRHIERMFTLANVDDPAVRAVRVFDLESAIAKLHWSNVDTRDTQKTYNLVAWSDAVGVLPALEHWAATLDAPAGAFVEIVLREPSFFESLGGLFTPERLDAWKDWLSWQVIHNMAPYLTEPLVSENFDFYAKQLTGTPEIRARWKRAVSLVEDAMGEAIGKIYVERFFPPEAKTAMDALVGHLVEAYRESITNLDWMSDDTRRRALDKLERFTPKIGYPPKWRDYSGLEITADDLIANIRAASEFEFQREFRKIGKPIDRDEWFMTPQTINAYYNPGFNEIVFPAAILQPPFFDAQRDAAANFGAIGAVIGHEIGHGFDDQGSRYDGDGRLHDWWTDADRAAFEKRTVSLIDQYNALELAQVPGHHVNGALTIGENIGDLGGLGIAWKAYLLSLDGAEPPVIDGYTGAQRFFLSWAAAWQQKSRDEEAIRLLAIDPHSPNEFRCNQIVRNIDVFYDAFTVREGDALWLDPAERVTIW